METDLTTNKKISTVMDLMSSVEEEINAIKLGTLDSKAGSLVMRGRALQLRGVELALQAARLDHSMRKDLGKRIGELPGAVVEVKSVVGS